MIIAWMLSSMVAGLLIGAAAWCVERVLILGRGLPLRFVWLAALCGALSISAAGLLPAPSTSWPAAPAVAAQEHRPPVASPAEDAIGIPDIPIAAPTRRPSFQWPVVSDRVARGIRTVWLSASLALLCALVWSSVRLRRETRSWNEQAINGTPVIVSNGFGPAIVGLVRPSIVVPPWVVSADPSTQHAILLHEEEHRRAGDQWLLMASFVGLVVAPWNVALWFMARRLARAIEWDCDERVLTHGVRDVDYANVLLSAWQQRTHRLRMWGPSPALAEHASRLGLRIEHLMRPTPQRRMLKTLSGMGASVLLIGGTAAVPITQQATRKAAQAAAQPAKVSPPEKANAPATSISKPPTVRAKAPSLASRASAPRALPDSQGISRGPMVTVTAQAGSMAPLQRARLAIVAPYDAEGMSWVEAVMEQLDTDARGQSLVIIPARELRSFLSASGYSARLALTERDVVALATMVRADLVVSVSNIGGSVGPRMVSLLGSGSPMSFRPLVVSEGTALSHSRALLEAVRQDTAYQRLRRPLAEVPVVTFKPAVVAPGSRGPVYPPDLRASMISGRVVASFVVDSTNRVDESTIAILASDRPQFSTAVIESLRTLRFLSALREGVKVRQQMQMGFVFVREEKLTAVSFVTDIQAIRAIREQFDARAREGVR